MFRGGLIHITSIFTDPGFLDGRLLQVWVKVAETYNGENIIEEQNEGEIYYII